MTRELKEQILQQFLSINIDNITEDIGGFAQYLPSKMLADEIAENANLGQRSLFTVFRDNAILVMPVKPSDEYLAYYKSIFGYAPMILTPSVEHSGSVCNDVLKDQKVFRQIRSMLRSTATTELVSYSATPEFYALEAALRGELIPNKNRLLLPEAPQTKPEIDMGTKSFLRKLYDDNKQEANRHGFYMPEGKVFENDYDAAIEYALDLYETRDRDTNEEKQRVVLKTDKGHAGMGVLIIGSGKESKLAGETREERRADLRKRMTEDYWRNQSIVVEEFIEADEAMGGGFPSPEYFIDDNGPRFLYTCGMSVTAEGVFRGVQIHKDLFPPAIDKKIRAAIEFCSHLLWKAGYRGYHDLDLIIDKKGNVYIDEVNLRRTGGTHTHETAVKLFGSNYIDSVALISENTYPFQYGGQLTFPDLYNLLEPIMFTPEKGWGVFICGDASFASHMLGYIIVGSDIKEAKGIQSEFEKLLPRAA